MMKRIFHCAGAQGYFTHKNFQGRYVEGAESVAESINQFMEQISEGMFHHAVFTYDTNFWFEYRGSTQSKLSPTIHSEYGSEGWMLSVNPDYLRASETPVYYMAKNESDFWGQKRQMDKIKIGDVRVNSTTLRYYDEVLGEAGLDAENILDVAAINPTTARTSLGNYLKDDSLINVIPLYKLGHESVFIYDQNGERKAAAFVFEQTISAYNNLFTYSQDKMTGPGIHRDQMLAGIDADTEVVIAGVPSDGAVKQVIIGYLERGCEVAVMRDLVKGTGRQIKDVASSPELRAYYQSGQLRLQNSPNYLAMLRRSLQRRQQAPSP